jgi:hypothetical protein
MAAPTPFITPNSTFLNVPTNHPPELPSKMHRITSSPENEALFRERYPSKDAPIRLDLGGKRFVTMCEPVLFMAYVKNLKSIGVNVEAATCTAATVEKWKMKGFYLELPEIDDTPVETGVPSFESVFQEIREMKKTMDGSTCIWRRAEEVLKTSAKGCDPSDIWLHRAVQKEFNIDDFYGTEGDYVEVCVNLYRKRHMSKALAKFLVHNREDLYAKLTELEAMFPYAYREHWTLEVYTYAP